MLSNASSVRRSMNMRDGGTICDKSLIDQQNPLSSQDPCELHRQSGLLIRLERPSPAFHNHTRRRHVTARLREGSKKVRGTRMFED